MRRDVHRIQVMFMATLALGLFCTSTVCAQAARSEEKSHIMLPPGAITWVACPPSVPQGAQCAAIMGDPTKANTQFSFRIKMPDNFRLPPHFHPADENIVVISGVFNMGLGDKFDPASMHALPVGSFAQMPKGTHHFASAKGETIVQLFGIGPWGITYVNPKDDPRNR